MDCKALKVAAFVAFPNIGGLIGVRFTTKNNKGWYENLKLPSWRPPNYVFGPVWAALYSGIGYASYLVWRDGGGFQGASSKLPLALYGFQIACNWAWAPIFFHYHNLAFSSIEILLLTATGGACAVSFYKVNQTAGLLFAPYIAWLCLASALNLKIWWDNRKSIKEKE